MPSPGERLGVLAARVGGSLSGDSGLLVTDLTHDSRRAGSGVLFVAVRGFHSDGHDFLAAAVEAGSPAVVTDHRMEVSVPQIVVSDTRAVLAALASAVFRDPSHELQLVGVTGTNGKTTVTHMLDEIARSAGEVAGLIGTVTTKVDGETIPSNRTTPEAPDFQRLLRHMHDVGARSVFAEVSSHALALGRVDSTRFEIAAFTNLSQDHLDFHADLEEYFEAKARLFEPDRSKRAVINVDDPAGRRLAGRIVIPVTSVGFTDAADFKGEMISVGVDHSVIEVSGLDRIRLKIGVGGEFNASNGLVAAAIARLLGYEWKDVATGLEGVTIPGRFEVVAKGEHGTAVVDYAHSPDSVLVAVQAARSLSLGRLIVVMGAGGDRDTSKRPAMGAGARMADLIFVTSDNPRSEDPDAIIRAIMSGIPKNSRGYPQVAAIRDRRQAIATALGEAGVDDIVLVLGKGHETGQEIGGMVYPFDDREVVREELTRLETR